MKLEYEDNVVDNEACVFARISSAVVGFIVSNGARFPKLPLRCGARLEDSQRNAVSVDFRFDPESDSEPPCMWMNGSCDLPSFFYAASSLVVFLSPFIFSSLSEPWPPI